jgi:hypothetical protein
MVQDSPGYVGWSHCRTRPGLLLPQLVYDPLPPRCIRILVLELGERSEPLEGHFIVASIEDKVSYDALSYVWGDPVPVHHIVINGAAISIARNLALALLCLRDSLWRDPLRIWIDAICIDQNNEIERGHQVAMMRSIFSKADCVRIWINEPDLDEESLALAALKDFHFQGNEPDHHYGLGVDIEFWEPLGPIFNNEYWIRLWM